MNVVTCVAPVNIAVVKYWGKRDEHLILPINDSISATLSTKYMCAKTTVMASSNFTENKFWLNGKEEAFDNFRLQNCLKEVRNRIEVDSEMLHWKIHIYSENNFPTAAGLASSAAGYSCLVFTLSKLYGIVGDISAIARVGSGSACRSVLGGWVQWHKGCKSDGSDSIATQIVPKHHWPEIRVLVLVVNDNRKKHSSTSAMQQTVATSALLKYRADTVVPSRVSAIKQAIIEKDFQTFATLTMQDSNQFHAVCLDTFPPCVYMNDISHVIVEMVHAYNEFYKTNKAAYTFDAGPNACIFVQENDVPEFIALISEIFPKTKDAVEYVKGIPVDDILLPEHLRKHITLWEKKHDPGTLKHIIHTKIGEGPKVLTNAAEHLLNEAGLPKK